MEPRMGLIAFSSNQNSQFWNCVISGGQPKYLTPGFEKIGQYLGAVLLQHPAQPLDFVVQKWCFA
jgi:hypothetical protein